MNQKGISSIVIILIIVGVLVVGGGVWYWQSQKEKPTACTQDAKLCPDGSYVSRTGPNCEFAACPEVKDETADWQTYRNEEYGFEVKYPGNFQLKNQYGETFLSPEKGPEIYIFAGKNLSAAFLECGGRCQYPESLVALSEKSGDWSKDYIFDYGGMGGWDTVVNAYQQKAGNYYILSLYASQQLGTPGMQGGGKPTREELIAPELKHLQDKNNKDIIIFNQILSTFKFTK